MSIYGATDTPVLDFWRCLLWVSKPEWAALFALSRGIHDIHFLRFTSGATPLLVYMASIAASCFPHVRVSAEVGCKIQTRMRDLPLHGVYDTHPCPTQKSDALTIWPQRPG